MPTKNLKTIQLDLFTNRGRGGKRTGAGRPRSKGSLLRHQTRPEFKVSQPLHVNVKLIKGLPTLRAKNKFKLIKRGILKARERGLRIIHFSIQSNHIHLLIESENKRELGRGMQSFCISLAKSLNGFLKRQGKVFVERYHLHILKTPTEVRNALRYIFMNFAKHTRTPHRFDAYSSLICFPDKIKLGLARVNTYALFKGKLRRREFKEEMNLLIAPAESWFLKIGWSIVK